MHPSLPIVSGALSAAAVGTLTTYFDQNIANRSDEFAARNALLPEGSAFAIWGPIYMGLVGLGIAQATPALKDKLAPARPWIAATPPNHLLWFMAVKSGQSFLSAMLIQTVMFGKAIALHRSLDTLNRLDASVVERTLRASAGLYLGWLGAANLPGWSTAALELGWDGQSPEVWGTAGVLTGAVAGAVVAEKADNPWIEVAFVNALAGIAVRQWKDERPVVAVAAGVCAAVGATRVIRGLWRRHTQRKRATQQA
jgi:hypothetical protein